MVKKLLEDFLDSPESYKRAEDLWEKSIDGLAASLHQKGQWKRWIPRHFANGTPMELDGNPIYDARNDGLMRAFRIIQHAPMSDDLEIVGWISACEEEYAELPRHELVINMSLSEESLSEALEILRMWMSPETTVGFMETHLKDTYPPVVDNGE
jgi:hypothetical protein